MLVDCIYSLMENWFDLSKNDISITIVCTSCLRKGAATPAMFPMRICEETFCKGEQEVFCDKEQNRVNIYDILPDWGLDVLSKTAYEAIEGQIKIGDGSFGDVFKGTYKGSVIVVKIFKSLSMLSELRREVLFTSIQHPNIVNVKGICINPLCILLEYVNGGDLERYLKNTENVIDLPIITKISRELAQAINFLHSQKPPIVHRDLKSPNILLMKEDDGQISTRLADFGTAGRAAPILEGRAVDNPLWLPPEVILEKYSTTKSDIYSYAMIVWELFSRSRPFDEYKDLQEGGRSYLLEDAIANQNLRPTIPHNCPKEWNELISICWARFPWERPKVQEVIEKINSIPTVTTLIDEITI